jgi:GT2 family glycosyltransferase
MFKQMKQKAHVGTANTNEVSPQQRPKVFYNENQEPVAAFKVDEATLTGGLLQIIGWSVGRSAMKIIVDGIIIPHNLIHLSRPDVAASLSLQESIEGFGFSLRSDIGATCKHVAMHWTTEVKGKRKEIEFDLQIKRQGIDLKPNKVERAGFGTHLSQTTEPFKAGAHFDHAGAVLGHYGLLAGWVVCRPGAEVLIADGYGNEHNLNEGIRYQRTDIVQIFGEEYGAGTIDAGFVIDWPYPQKKGDPIRIIIEDHEGKHLIVERGWDEVPNDAVSYARWAFSVPTPPESFNQRLEMGEAAFLEKLITKRNYVPLEAQRPLDIHEYGALPANPKYSIIVPLYGRWDFVEHQLLEFSKDPIFQQDAELIYVIDDPSLITPIISETENLLNYYHVPFKLVWGHRNRGFSGASNLGASVARGSHLLFLNSDAFPTQPGWVEAMGNALDTNPEFGMIGARLLFPDGGLQHAGMEFFFSTTWGVWLNKHPKAGLDPILDPVQGLIELPAVTGACMMMRQPDFAAVEGFDQGYLIGDFEDSDLCMKVRAAGLKIGYLPEATLVHLERQSFRLLGDGSFRNLVVRFNAWRHHQRWGTAIGELMANYN